MLLLSLRAPTTVGAWQSRAMQEKVFCVYIMTNQRHTVLYTGVTRDLQKRVWEHKTKAAKGFTAKYNVDKLVYYEVFGGAEEAIAREKQIKAGSREKKIALIEKMNSKWEDLSIQL